MAIMQATMRPSLQSSTSKIRLLATCIGLIVCTFAQHSNAQMIGGPRQRSTTPIPVPSPDPITDPITSPLPDPLISNSLLANTASNYQIIGYYPSWRSATYPVSKIDPKALTVIHYAFLNLCWNGKQGNPAPDAGGQIACKNNAANGAVVLGDYANDPANLSKLVGLKSINPKLKIVPSVGGWTWSNQFSNMAASASTRNNFINSALALVRQYKLDGIDIDWEYPSEAGIPCTSGNTCQRPSDKKNFVLLAQALRSAFDAAGKADGKQYLITIAAGASSNYVNDKSTGNSAWIKSLAASLDWINLMSYDFHGPWNSSNGHVAPLYADPANANSSNLNTNTGVNLYLAAGVLANKLVLGMPFYGYGWKGCATGADGTGQYQACQGSATGSSGATFDFNYLTSKGLLSKDANGKYTKGGQGYARYWNASSRVPYLYNASTKTFISYDDETSIHEKNLYIKAKGLRGAMFWELSADNNQLLNKVISQDLPH